MLHLAENTVQFDRKLALVEFRDAFTDARIMEVTYRAPLQSQIVVSVAPIDIPTATDLVRVVRPNPAQRLARDSWDHAVDMIDSQLLVHNRGDEAVELIKLVSTPGIFPNLSASNILKGLPVLDDRRLGLFGYAASCYRQVSFPGFTDLVKEHWQSMPRALVVLAANAVADDSSHASTAELKQILPILRDVDPPRAERLLSDHPEIQDPPAPKKARKPSSQEQNDQRQLDSISRTAVKYPLRALSMVESVRDPDTREQITLQIAEQALQSGGDPDVASKALDVLMKLPPTAQRDLAAQLAELAAYSGRAEVAAHFVDAAFEVAAKLLEADNDAKSDCGINPAPKDWWPSTAAYREAIHASVSLFHTGAERFLSPLQHDSDLYLLMSVEFARALLGGGPTATPKLTCADAVAFVQEAESR